MPSSNHSWQSSFSRRSLSHPTGNKQWKTQYIKKINKFVLKQTVSAAEACISISPQLYSGVGYVESRGHIQLPFAYIVICLSVSPEMIGYANRNSSVTARRVVTLSLTTLRMERWNQFWQPHLISTLADLHNTRHVNQLQMWQGN